MLVDMDALDRSRSDVADPDVTDSDVTDSDVTDSDVAGGPVDDEVTEAPETGPSPTSVLALVFALVGLRIGLSPLHDNSFLTHLATGRIIVDTGHIPRSDPYSWTAPGAAWTVQSWGASVIYAGAEKVAGLMGIRIIVTVCCVALTQLVWRLTKPSGSLLGRLLVTVPVIAVGTAYWVERPFLFSLVFLMAVLFALEDRFDPRWLVPIMWLWVNVHGSFPLAFVAIGCFLVGRLLDRERPTVELRVLLWTAVGTLVGAVVSPIGWDLITFPAKLLQHSEAFAHTAEWESPSLSESATWMYLFQLILAVGLVLFRRRRWRAILPVVVFGALSLQASRNIAQASLVLIVPMAFAATGLGEIEGTEPRRILRPVQGALVALFVLIAAVGLFRQPDAQLDKYPEDAVTWMDDQGMLGPDSRVVSRDFVGNYLEARYRRGPDAPRVFFDDRVDMYPMPVVDQYMELIDVNTQPGPVLDDLDASAVLWDTDSPFGDWLEDPANGWKVVHEADDWIVAVPAGAPNG